MEKDLCHNKLKVTHKDSNIFEAFVRVLKAGQAKYKDGDYAPTTHSLKPTLILTNCTSWQPKPMVLARSVRHWNTLSKKKRTIIPRELCREVAAAVTGRACAT